MINLTLDRGDLVQAFPVHETTISGTFTNQDVTDYIVLHADDNITVTVGFLSGPVAVNMIQGEDISLGEGSLVVTTSGACKIS